jgi:hypothetical protein
MDTDAAREEVVSHPIIIIFKIGVWQVPTMDQTAFNTC